MVFKFFIVTVCLVLVAYEVDAARGSGKRKGKKPAGDKSIDEDQLSNEVQGLKDKFDELMSEGTCSTGNVHFYFHGESDGHDHQVGDNDQHVHVHVHTKGDHSMHGHDDGTPHYHKAVCDMHYPSIDVNGTVRFTQASNEHHARVDFDFTQLGSFSDGKVNYVAHVHVSGDLTLGCSSTAVGPHYDPYDENVDVGDLGVIGTKKGKVTQQHPETFLTLFGDYSIVGRSVMIHHENHDVLSCCVIGWARDDYRDDIAHAHLHDIDHGSHTHDHSGHGHSHSHDHDHHDH